MLTTELLVYPELDHQMFIDLMEDYPVLPTYKVMREEVKGYDLVELNVLRRNFLTMKEYLTWGPDCCLDTQQREFCHMFIAGYMYVLDMAIVNCQLVYTN